MLNVLNIFKISMKVVKEIKLLNYFLFYNIIFCYVCLFNVSNCYVCICVFCYVVYVIF